mgnify:CR=1 FL=1
MSQNLLDIYSDYLIAQSHYATATGLSNLLEGSISHDRITRFLNSNKFDSKDLWQYVKRKIRQHEKEKGGVLILDDSIEEKPYTDENPIVSWHFAHAKGRCVKGLNLLSCLVRYDDFALPIGFNVIRKDLHYCDLKTKKVVKKASITKNEHFRSLIKQAVLNQVKFEYILADNWFGSKENMEFIHNELDKEFIFGLKANRLITFSEEESKKGQYQNLRLRQIVCVLRHKPLENGWRALETTLKNRDLGVVAIDLAGDENALPAATLKPVFDLAHKEKLPVIIHAGEARGADSVWEALDLLGACRIGHGVRSIEDEVLMQRLIREQIPLETCPTSNIATKAIRSWDAQPTKKLLDRGLFVTVNTDARTTIRTTLTDEYVRLNRALGLSFEEIQKIIGNGFKSAFDAPKDF